jgi:hypothetical protein
MIGEYAFYGCPSLKKVTLTDYIGRIGDYAFGYIENDLGEGVKKMEDFWIECHGGAGWDYSHENGLNIWE